MGNSLPPNRKEAKEKESKYYFTGNSCNHGHLSKRLTSTSQCCECNRIRSAEYYKNNQSRLLEQDKERRAKNRKTIAARRKVKYQKNKNQILRRHREKIESNPAKYLWKSAKARAKRKKIPFTITIEEVEKLIPKTLLCPILGIDIRIEKKKSSKHSITLDRIIPALGYVPGNVVVISHLANTLKSDVTDPDVFRKIAAWLEKTLNKL